MAKSRLAGKVNILLQILCLGADHIQYVEVIEEKSKMDQVRIIPANEDGLSSVAAVELVPVTIAVDDVHGIITRVVAVARAAGRDYVEQCRSAAEAVVAVRHDLSFTEALSAVYRVRERDAA